MQFTANHCTNEPWGGHDILEGQIDNGFLDRIKALKHVRRTNKKESRINSHSHNEMVIMDLAR